MSPVDASGGQAASWTPQNYYTNWQNQEGLQAASEPIAFSQGLVEVETDCSPAE